MSDKAKTILISTGELSGELHASQLVQDFKKKFPTVKFYGMGAEVLQQAGVQLLVHTKKMSLIGLLGIVIQFPILYRAFRIMTATLQQRQIDLLILVDYPGFNLRLAKIAHQLGIKVLYFISPKVWAWKLRRVETIRKYVDMMAVIFPFEVEFYQKYGIPVRFVGNKLLMVIQDRLSHHLANDILQVKQHRANHTTIIGLFPGSRTKEIERLLPIMLQAAERLKKNRSNIHFILPRASSISVAHLQKYLQHSSIAVQVVNGHNYEVMQATDVIITASGTATFEMALIGTPHVIIYRLSWLEYQIAKRLIKIPYIGLSNILAGKKIAPELIQQEANPEKIASAVEKILDYPVQKQQIIADLHKITQTFQETPSTDLNCLIADLINLSH